MFIYFPGIFDFPDSSLERRQESIFSTIGRLYVDINRHHLWRRDGQIKTEMKNEPNKAVEPTPVSVTISAAQKVAPLTSVAHLRR
jgi:hypothetical protein